MSSAGLPASLTALLRAVRMIRVATLTPSGSPHAAPYWCSWDGEHIVLDTLENQTVRNIRGSDRVTVLVEAPENGTDVGSGLIRGRARCYGAREAPQSVHGGIEALRAAHAGEISSPAFQAYAATVTRALVFVAITPVSWEWVAPRVRVDRPARQGQPKVSSSAVPAPVARMLEDSGICRLCTAGTDGWPRLRTFVYGWDGERLVVPTGTDPAVDDVLTDARAAVLVDLGTRFEDLRGALVHGQARVWEPPSAPPLVRAGDLVDRCAGAPAVSLEICPERATWWDLAGPLRR